MEFNYFVSKKYREFVKNCFLIFNTGEPGIYFFPPKTDRIRRIDQLIQQYSTKYNLIKFELTPHSIEDYSDLKYAIEKQINNINKLTFIFIINAEAPIIEKNYSLLDDVVKIQETYQNLRFILFTEIDLTHPDIVNKISRTSIYSNLYYYSLYDKNDTYSFMKYLIKKWQLRIDSKTLSEIYIQCGGHFWLIKQAIRIYKDDPTFNLKKLHTSEAIKFRFEQIYLSLLESEKSVIQKLIINHKIDDQIERHSLSYLNKIGFVNKNKIAIPLIEKYVSGILPKTILKIVNGKINVNNVNIENFFSKNEKKALKALLNYKNKIITREDIAKAIWPINTDDYYSDWAIDRIIARLRGKIIQLNLSKTLIKTIRNKGFIFVN